MPRLYGRRWKAASDAFIAAHPLCRFCEDAGRVRASEVTDHIVPHRGDARLFWDSGNWMALCKHCHDSRKQRIERRGYSEACGEDGWPLDPLHPFNAGVKKGSGPAGHHSDGA